MTTPTASSSARSTNGGFTWSRPCVPIQASDTDPDASVCGGPGDPRQPGDGTVDFEPDDNRRGSSSRRVRRQGVDRRRRRARRGVQPRCFAPVHTTPVTCDPAVRRPSTGSTSPGRSTPSTTRRTSSSPTRTIRAARGREPRTISGERRVLRLGPGRCNDNQFSVPTVDPTHRAALASRSRTSTPRTRTSTCRLRSARRRRHVRGPVLRDAGVRPSTTRAPGSRRARTGPTARSAGRPAGRRS